MQTGRNNSRIKKKKNWKGPQEVLKGTLKITFSKASKPVEILYLLNNQ